MTMGTVTVLPTQGETFTRSPTRFDRAAQLVVVDAIFTK